MEFGFQEFWRWAAENERQKCVVCFRINGFCCNLNHEADSFEVSIFRYGNRSLEILSVRLEHIDNLFGQIPGVLEDVWIDVALRQIEKAQQTIAAVPPKYPFEMKYNQIKKILWETCAKVLDSGERKRYLMQGVGAIAVRLKSYHFEF